MNDDEHATLRRRLRAQAALNHQLRAQLDAANARLAALEARTVADDDPLAAPERPAPLGAAPRRATKAGEWIPDLVPAADDEAPVEVQVVARADGAVFVVEGAVRRRIRAGFLTPAIERIFGDRRAVSDEDVEAWAEGPPVEVLEASAGAPFVVLGGQAHPVRGIPLPHPVDQAVADSFPTGASLDLAADPPRRSELARDWLDDLAPAQPADGDGDTGSAGPPASLQILRGPDGAVWVVDGDVRRRVKAGLLAAALERVLGERRRTDDEELATWPEGPPVEVLEGPDGPPFIVLGGQRRPVKGLPLPHPVRRRDLEPFAEGEPVDVTPAPPESPPRATGVAPTAAAISRRLTGRGRSPS